MQAEHDIVTITEQPVELCKLLKIANMVGGGGEAKIVISEGYVLLNGEVEFRKRKKVVAGDVIEFNGETVTVVLDEARAKSPVQTGDHNKPVKKAKKEKGKCYRRG